MTAGTECVSAAAEKPTTNWPTWHCQEACSRTVPLRPETLDRPQLTVWTAKSADSSIRQSGVLVDQARRRHALWTEVAWCASMQGFVCQNSRLVQYPFWGPQPVKTDKCSQILFVQVTKQVTNTHARTNTTQTTPLLLLQLPAKALATLFIHSFVDFICS